MKPFSSGKISWFNPGTGEWNGSAEITKNSKTLLTPTTGDWRLATGDWRLATGDWVVLAKRG